MYCWQQASNFWWHCKSRMWTKFEHAEVTKIDFCGYLSPTRIEPHPTSNLSKKYFALKYRYSIKFYCYEFSVISHHDIYSHFNHLCRLELQYLIISYHVICSSRLNFSFRLLLASASKLLTSKSFQLIISIIHLRRR